MWDQRDQPGAYAGSYTGRGYNEFEEIAPGHAIHVAQAVASTTSSVLAPRQLIDGLPAIAFGNLGLGLIGLTALLIVLRRAL